MVKVVVAIASSGRYVPPEWAVGLASLVYPHNCTHAHLCAKGAPTDQARNTLVKQAQAMLDPEYLLFLDDDTVPPPDTVLKLLKELETAPDQAVVCGGIYTSKTPSPEPLVFMEEGGGPFWKWKFGDVFPVWGIATGCMLIKMSVFRDLPEPWFKNINSLQDVDPEKESWLLEGLTNPIGLTVTDDLYFCKKLRAHGYEILAHGGVLPLHYNQEGKSYHLASTDYPLKGVDWKDIWYLPERHIKRNEDDGLPPGWLTREEADALIELTRGKRVLEMGAYLGRSAVAMAPGATHVVSVDWHRGDETIGGKNTFEEYRKNIDPYPNITPIVARFDQLPEALKGATFDVVFIDGSHDHASVIQDMAIASSFKPSLILAHDYNGFSVKEALDTLGITPTRVVGSLAVIEPT